ncbi:MAG: hypothetical protein M1832_002611 [Thelocarpon impressellum]|nr:MAG: hypothetical protein M1832_002611 [Thelocarpon impressellum]
MAETNGATVAHRPRKSVAFEEGATVVGVNGEEQQTNGTAKTDSTDAYDEADGGEKASDEVTAMFDGLTKKKKPKKAKDDKKDEGEAAGGEFDATALKKKKKKKATKTADEGDNFEAKLAEAGVAAEEEEAAVEATPEEDEADLEKGTGIWAHSATTPINYPHLLTRFFTLLHSHHPDLASSGSKSYKIPPPQCLREGNKKTIFANIAEICKRMKRSDEHVTQFLFAELGTSGSVDGSRRLVIKGRYQQKQIENVLRRYIVEYVTCKTCRSPDTELSKGENRLYFVTCNSCGSRRSVTAIKTGFTAQIGKRRRQQQG